MTLETILLAIGTGDTNRADRLTETTIEVAKPVDATVILAHIFTEDEYERVLNRLDLDPASESTTPDGVARQHSVIQNVGSQLEKEGVGYEVRGVIGEPGLAISDLGFEISADRIIVGGRKRNPTGKAIFGSTAQEIMMESPCPVTFVRETD